MRKKLRSILSGTAQLVAVFLMLSSAHSALAQNVAVTHCQGPCPNYSSQLTANRSNVVIHHLYAAGINGDTSLPDWVAYRLTKEAIGVASLLPRTWRPDRLVEFSPLEDIMTLGEVELNLSETIAQSSNQYGGSAELVEPENRARLAPMTSFANTPYWSDLNNFSNMVPMPAPLRLGPWLRLEQRLNGTVKSDDEVYVITGPLFLISNLSVAPSSADLNPAAYFKVISDQSGVAAFVFPHTTSQSDNYCDHQANVTEIEAMVDLEFFPERGVPSVSQSLLGRLGCQ